MSTVEASINRPSQHLPAPYTAATPSTAVICLGTAGIVRDLDGTPSILVGLGKPMALLAYLSLSPNRTASRERLADLLWSDQDRVSARTSLRRALSLLRSRVGEWVVDGDDASCSASATLEVDVLRFRELAERGDYAGAVCLYAGDFLADFASPGSREFESWASIERAHLRSLAKGAAEAWCRQSLDRG